MKHACQYAIVRFLPFVETGEFANVGIVLMCPEIGYFDFRLLNQVRRITAFFDQLDSAIYRNAKKDLRNDLLRFKSQIAQGHQSDDRTAKFMFQELVRPREIMLRFDAPRVVLTDDPTKKLEELFSFYVERNFVTPEYIEQRLEKTMRTMLVNASVKDMYHEARVEYGAFHARFPFAHVSLDGEVLKAIKPLHLAHQDPANAYEHGWAWVGKIRQLKKYDVFPRHVLIAAQAPTSNNEQSISVYNEIRKDFENMDVEFTNFSDAEKIVSFAKFHLSEHKHRDLARRERAF